LDKLRAQAPAHNPGVRPLDKPRVQTAGDPGVRKARRAPAALSAARRRRVGHAGPPRGPISFLSDYGFADEFVGVVHRVLAGVAPGVTVIDVTHQIPAHDPRAGALTLWRAAPWLVPGVVLAIVDPGVGTARRAVAIEVTSAGAVLVGPDNGLLLPAATSLGPITAAVELHPTVPPGGGGATFAGRDVFAPAAGRLAGGAELGAVGDPIDPASLAGDPVPAPEPAPDGGLLAEILWVDRFGNAQLNARPGDAAHLGGVITVTAGAYEGPARRVAAFAELNPDEVGLLNDSYGLLALTCRDASAASRFGLNTGDAVWLRPHRGG
jgi:S-adenosylmethionine hydrolase